MSKLNWTKVKEFPNGAKKVGCSYRGHRLVMECSDRFYGGLGITSVGEFGCATTFEEMESRLIRHVDNIEDSRLIIWHPYPQEVPPHYGEYLVTASDDMMERTSFIDLWHYCKNDEFQKVGYMLPPETHVIAWAKKPGLYFRREK